MPQFDRRVQIAVPSPKKLFTPAVTAILILMVVGFALLSYAEEFTTNFLAVSAYGVLHGRIWQLITYPFITSRGGIIFNALLILFVGSSIERQWSTARFALLWLVVSVTCGALWVIVQLIARHPFFGTDATACCYGLVAVFGVVFRGRRFLALFWTVEAQHLALGLIAIGIVLGIGQMITWIWVAGAAVAFVYTKLQLAAGQRRRHAPTEARRDGFVDID